MPTEPRLPREPSDLADRFALSLTRLLRVMATGRSCSRQWQPCLAWWVMVGSTATHLQCLRRMVEDDGWIRTLMEEAENERMYLMTFIEVAGPPRGSGSLSLSRSWV